MSVSKMHVKTGDLVKVRTGKDRGKEGKVVRVLPEQQRVVVEGINMVKRHVRPTGRTMQAGIIDQEAPIHASNVALVCPNCNEPTRTGHRFLSDGTKVRTCKRCGEDID